MSNHESQRRVLARLCRRDCVLVGAMVVDAMSRRTARRQRFYAHMRRERLTPKWLWTIDMTDLIPISSIERLMTRMQSWPKVVEPATQEPDPLF